MDVEQFRAAGYAAIDAICDYYATLSTRTVKAQVEPGFLVEQLPKTAPDDGEDIERITGDFQRLIMPGITHWQHERFMAYFPANSTFESMLAELYSASVANPGFNWVCSPACTELEQVMMDWMADMLGLEFKHGGGGGGVIHNSASEAALTAAIAARGDRNGNLVMYGSTQTHSLGAKAALILGVTFRAVAVDDDYVLRGGPLRAAIEKDIADGLVPFFCIATVGTTSTGAVDNVAEVGAVAKDFGLFLHVDAAWAGVALALPEQRSALRLDEINAHADSFCTNAHKWGLVSFDCSLFYVRNRQTLNDALDVTPSFLRSKEADAGTVIDYRNWQLALGRRFRSIKLWFVMRSYGRHGFQAHLRKGIEQAKQLSQRVQAPFDLVAHSLGLVVFRYGDNVQCQALYNALNARHDVFLTQTMLHSNQGDVYAIRIALGGKRTEWNDVEAVWEIIRETARAL